MSWQERVLNCSYTSPSGKTISFSWDSVERETELKTSAFTFPELNGAHIQHYGYGIRTFPMTCVFSGEDCLDDADEFESMLCERGVGKLQHPYGQFNVVPMGNIKRNDDFVKSLNESTVSITFAETIVDNAGASVESISAESLSTGIDDLQELAAQDFAGMLEISNQTAFFAFIAKLKSIVNQIKKNINKILEATKDLQDLSASIESQILGYTSLIEKTYQGALNIGRTALKIIRLPSKVINNIKKKISGYKDITKELISEFKNVSADSSFCKNDFATARLIFNGVISSCAEGIVNDILISAKSESVAGGNASEEVTEVEISREDALNAVQELYIMLDDYKAYLDLRTASGDFFDSAFETYFVLVKTVYSAAQIVLNEAFSLPMKKTIMVEEDRHFIELCAELYGSVENKTLDKFLNDNKITASEMDIIPAGREVFYYVEST